MELGNLQNEVFLMLVPEGITIQNQYLVTIQNKTEL